jgi:hypothetical protein
VKIDDFCGVFVQVSSTSEQVSRWRGVLSVRREVWSRRGILSHGTKIGKDLLNFFSTFSVSFFLFGFFELLIFAGAVCHVVVFDIVVVFHVFLGGVERGDLA